MDVQPSMKRAGNSGGDSISRLCAEAARTHNLIGALSFRRSSFNEATDHYRITFQFLLRREEEVNGIRTHDQNHEDQLMQQQIQACSQSMSQEHEAERTEASAAAFPLTNENSSRQRHTSITGDTGPARLQNCPYFLDEQGDCFILDGNLFSRQVAGRPPTAEDFHCISSTIVMFNLSLCHYSVGRYEQSLELLDLAARCLTGGSEVEPWGMHLWSAIMDNLNYIAGVYQRTRLPLADIIASPHDFHSPAA